MKKEGVIINQKEHTDIFNWLSENVYYYKEYQKHYTLTSEGKINVYWNLLLHDDVTQIKYPFGYVKGDFICNKCRYLTSLVGAPEKVDGYFNCSRCENLTSLVGLPKKIKNEFHFTINEFSNNPKYKEEYKLYLAMWLELLESVNNEERKEYITNYKDKKNYYNEKKIIPIEILKEYGF